MRLTSSWAECPLVGALPSGIAPQHSAWSDKSITIMELYTKVITLKLSEVQKSTLDKLRTRNIKVSDFIRKAIAEKIKRDAKELIIKEKPKYPF